MRFILSAFSLFCFGLLAGQKHAPLEMDSTGKVVYYAQTPIESGKELKAEEIFIRGINLNSKDRGNAIFFHNPTTHLLAARCYFKTMALDPFPTRGVCNFTWSFSIKDNKVRIFLYNIYWFSDELHTSLIEGTTMSDLPAVITAEWINDYRNEYPVVGKASDKIDSQLKYFIKLFKEGLASINKDR